MRGVLTSHDAALIALEARSRIRGWYVVVPALRLLRESVHLERTYVGRIEALQSAEIRPRATGYVTAYF